MVNGQLNIVVQQIGRMAGRPSNEGLSDGQLLHELDGEQQGTAFAVLVRRHGPMVLGVCRRMLGNAHDAEEAFQATFLVFFRRAHALGRRGSIANWLYTVAYHVALKARAGHARRRLRERQVVEMRQTATQPREIWTDLQPVLDEELNRLPEKYPALVVLCYLEGKTNEEAAKLLGCPAGTVKGRLSRRSPDVTQSPGAPRYLVIYRAYRYLADRTDDRGRPASAGKTHNQSHPGRCRESRRCRCICTSHRSGRRSAESHVHDQTQDRNNCIAYSWSVRHGRRAARAVLVDSTSR